MKNEIMHKTEIIKSISHYTDTGVIDEKLIPFYDQDGRWRGDQIDFLECMPKKHMGIMEKSLLPPSRRTSRDRNGTILRTSYIIDSSSRVDLTLARIEGSLIATGNTPLRAAGLLSVGGHVIVDTDDRIQFPLLGSVGGNFEAIKGFQLTAPRLRHVGGKCDIYGRVPPRLETIGGKFGAYWVFDLNVPRLRHVGGSLVASKAATLNLPSLVTVGGGILLSHLARELIVPKLLSVGGDLFASSVTKLIADELQSVGGDLDTRSAENFYYPDIRVGGEWTVFPGAIERYEFEAAVLRAIRCNEPPYEL